jgi:hypothetical protein
MADKKISELTAKTTPVALDMIPIYDSVGLVTAKISPLNLGIGSLGASAWVIASDAPALIKTNAEKLESLGYPVWVCDGTADDVQIQAAINALPVVAGWQVGKVYLSSGNYDIRASLIPPTGAIYSDITIEGEGILATRLSWNTGVAGNYILNWSSSTNGARLDIHLKGIGFYGGGSGTETGKAINMVAGHANVYIDLYADYISAEYCVSPAINLEGLHFNDTRNVIANSNTGWDLAFTLGSTVSFGTQLQLFGGSIQKIRVLDEGITAFGANLSHVDVEQNTNMITMFNGCFFDPVPTGYVSNIILGSAGVVRNPIIIGNAFKMSQTELQAGGFYIDLQHTIGASITGNTWRVTTDGDPATTYINIVSGSYFTDIEEVEYFPYERIADASYYNRVKGHETLDLFGGGTGGTIAITTSSAGFTYSTLGASANWTFTLPQVVHKGCSYKFIVGGTAELRIDPGAAGAFYINGAKQTDDKYISANAIGESIEVIADGNGDWLTYSMVGTWTVE